MGNENLYRRTELVLVKLGKNYDPKLSDTIEENLNTLTESQKKVIKDFYGLEGKKYSVDEISLNIGFNKTHKGRERVRAIKDKAILKLGRSGIENLESLLK